MANRMHITINREFGSGGRLIGEALAEALGIKLVDKLILEEAAKAMKLSPNYLKQFEEKAPSFWDTFSYQGTSFHGMSIPMYYNSITNNDLYIMQAALIKELAQQESCVFIGRCANEILKDEPHVVSVFLYSSMEHRIKNLTEKYGFVAEKNIEKEIKKVDRQRAEYYRIYADAEWHDMRQYDLCIDTSKLSIEEVVRMIVNYTKVRNS